MMRILVHLAMLSGFLFTSSVFGQQAKQPAVGGQAPDFVLSTTAGKRIQLSELTAKGPVALIVLRGYPGYQCPFCNRQAQNLIQSSDAFSKAGLHVVMVYPGPPQDLAGKANEFLTDKKLPDSFDFVLDPDYKFTNQYGLRWDAEHETAFPSTFLIDHDGMIFFSKIVRVHGSRTTAAELLEAMPKAKLAGY